MTAYTDGQVTLRSNRAKIGYHEAADLSGYQGVEPGDFVVHGLDIMRGSVGVSDSAGAISSVCTVCQPSELVEARFVAYAMRVQAESGYPKALARGVREGGADFRRWDTLAELPIPVPEVKVQRLVADFLDRETAEIDAFIADQDELIGLLAERRAATISHAVTKGLDPTVRMKESAVEWLGDVPEHWTVNRLSRCVRINEGQVDPEAEPFVDMILIAPNHIESRTGRTREFETAREQAAESGKYLVRRGQVIYSKIRPALAKVVVAPFDCLCSADMYGLSATDSRSLSNQYLRWMLLSQSFTDYAIDQSARVAMPKLNQDTLGAAPVWYPSLQEQHAITAWITRETTELDATISDAEEAIALSRERRAALISAAVTGKIDVHERGVA